MSLYGEHTRGLVLNSDVEYNRAYIMLFFHKWQLGKSLCLLFESLGIHMFCRLSAYGSYVAVAGIEECTITFQQQCDDPITIQRTLL